MIGLVRALAICASLIVGLAAAQAADKAFRRDDLADSAIKLEAQIKTEAGPVSKSSAALRTDATRRSSAMIFALACRPWGRSPRSRPRTAATGCGLRAPPS